MQDNIKFLIINFTSKKVVIIGGTTGIRLATAKAFIIAGANVWITGRNTENLQKAAGEINSPNLKTVLSDTPNWQTYLFWKKQLQIAVRH